MINVFEDKSLKDVVLVNETNYKPDGTTGLLDSIGKTINKYEKEKNVYFVILTDGFENSSTEYTSKDINKLITTKKNNGWKFNFLGTNQDSWKVGNKMGLERVDCMNYENSSEGLIRSFRQVGTIVRESTQPGNIFE